MLKKLLTLFVLAFCCLGNLCVSAQSTAGWTSGDGIRGGQMYLYNIGAKRYLSQGTTWNTHAILDGSGLIVNSEWFDYGGSFYTGITNSQIPNSGYLGLVGDGVWVDREQTRFDLEVVDYQGYTNACLFSRTVDDITYYLGWAGGGPGNNGNEIIVSTTRQITPNFLWLTIDPGQRTSDYTYKITNPDFEQGINGDFNENNVPGWSFGGFKRSNNGNSTNCSNAVYVNKWQASGALSNDQCSQTVSGLPAGKYTVTVTAKATSQGNASSRGVSLFIGDASTKIGAAGTYSATTTLPNGGSLNLGVKIDNTDANWVAFDNVRLYREDIQNATYSWDFTTGWVTNDLSDQNKLNGLRIGGTIGSNGDIAIWNGLRFRSGNASLQIPVKAGQIVTLNTGAYQGSLHEASVNLSNVVNKTSATVTISGNTFKDIVCVAASDGSITVSNSTSSAFCIRNIKVENAPGFRYNNQIVQLIPRQDAELTKLEFDEPEIVAPSGSTISYASSNYKIAYCPSNATQTIEGYTWSAEPSQVGQVRFTGTGIVGITATINYGGYTWTLNYDILVHADEASKESVGNEYRVYGHNTSSSVLTTGGKLADRIVKLANITAEFGPSDIFNTTIVRAIDGNINNNTTVGVTTLATNGWRDAYFQGKQPKEGTFYKFIPEASGKLTVTGYLDSSNGVPAIMVDADNNYSVVGTINHSNNSTLETSTFNLVGGHTYYLFGVNPNYPDYSSYSNSDSWAIYQLVSIKFEPTFRITTVDDTDYLTDNNNEKIKSPSVVRSRRDPNHYPANFSGAAPNSIIEYTCTAYGNISINGLKEKSYTTSSNGEGEGQIDVAWDAIDDDNPQDDEKGGAIVVKVKEQGSGHYIYFTVTIPYRKHTWDMWNYQSDVNKEFGTEDLVKWSTTYEVRQYNSATRALTYLNEAVLTSAGSIARDNAAYIGQTAGLVVEAKDNSFGVNYFPPDAINEYIRDNEIQDVNGDGRVNYLDLDESTCDEQFRKMLTHTYTAEDIPTAHVGAMNKGAWLTIPGLNQGQHVAIKWYRHGPNQGDNIHVTGVHNLKKWIDGVEDTNPDTSKELDVTVINQNDLLREKGTYNIYNSPFGWLEFVVAENGSVTFHVTDNGFTHIKQITISGKDEEIDSDLKLNEHEDNYQIGDEAIAGTTFFRHLQGNEDPVVHQYANGQYMHGESFLPCEFRLRNIKGTFSQITLTSGNGTYTYTPSTSVKGRSNAPVNFTTSFNETFDGDNKYIYKQGGLLTVVDGQGSFDLEQITYSNDNAVEYEKTPIYVVEIGTVAQSYPYTWDFTNISKETKQTIQSNNSYWLADGTNLYRLNDTGMDNYVQGTQLTSNGGTDNSATTLPEFEGLGFYTSSSFDPSKPMSSGMNNVFVGVPNGSPQKPTHGNSEGLVIGNKETTTLIVPNVTPGMTVYVRTDIKKSVDLQPISEVSLSGKIDGVSQQEPLEVSEGGIKEYVYTYNVGEHQQDVYIDVKNVTVKAIGVTKFSKRCWFKNDIESDEQYGYFYNTDSHDKPIDYTLTKYFKNKEIQAFSIGTFNKSSVTLYDVSKVPANTGYIVKIKYDYENNEPNIEKLPLFVPSVNDKNYNMTDLDGCLGWLLPHVASGPIYDKDTDGDGTYDTRQDDDYYYYILTNLWYNVNTGSSDNKTTASVPGFYRFVESNNEADNNLSNNRAVLRIPKDQIDGGVKQFIPLFQFEGDMADAIDTVSVETNESVIDMNGSFYTLQGLKIEGFPKKSGIYMQNGKKILVK